MTYARYLILFITTFFSLNTQAQIKQFDVETALEALFALPESNLNYEELYERYLLLYENPLDLNTANYSDLKGLHVFSEREITAILTYRDSIGAFQTKYELAYLAGMDVNKIQRISILLSIEPSNSIDSRQVFHSLLSQRNAYLITRYERRLEQASGFKGASPAFAGDPNKLYMRYRNAIARQFSFGITAEKDPGEAFIFDKSTFRKGMDFWSAHLMLEKRGKFEKVIVGDYQLQFGQGLIFSSGLGIGKGAETINTAEKVYNGIRPYTSVIEGGFMRGAAATFELTPKVDITGFLSSLRQDAVVLQTADSQNVFSSLQFTGLHRTISELARKKSVKEQIAGINLLYHSRNLNQIGILWQASHFSKAIDRGNDPSVNFEFGGKQNMNLSVYGNQRLKQFRLFGEFAMSQNGALGFITGIEGNLAPRLQSVLMLRSYDKSFHSLRSGAFGENIRNINESGIYLGLKYTFNQKFYTTLYYDRFNSEWLQFRARAPAKGFDYLIRLNYKPNARSQMYFQYRFKQKDRNIRVDNEITVLPGISRRFIFHLDFMASNHLNLRSKVQWSTYHINQQKTKGIAFFQDANFNYKKFKVSARFSIFDTEAGDNRQYAYERDVLYAFSIPGLSGTGIRNYLLAQYSPIRNLDIWLKLSRTTFFDREQFGTGVNAIAGNKLTDLKLQTMIKF